MRASATKAVQPTLLILISMACPSFAEPDGEARGCHGNLAKLIKSTPPIETQTLPGNLKRVAGGASLQDARVIGLGDFHTDKTRIAQAAAIIDKYGNEGDIVLIEGLASGKVVPQADYLATHGIQKQVTVMGWDNMAALEQSVGVLEAFVKLQKSAASPDEKLRSEQPLTKRLNQLTHDRNRTLVSNIVQALNPPTPGRKVWVLAGTAHLSDEYSPVSRALSGGSVPHAFFGNEEDLKISSSDAELEGHLNELNLHRPK
jgi:hypothetical protein